LNSDNICPIATKGDFNNQKITLEFSPLYDQDSFLHTSVKVKYEKKSFDEILYIEMIDDNAKVYDYFYYLRSRRMF